MANESLFESIELISSEFASNSTVDPKKLSTVTLPKGKWQSLGNLDAQNVGKPRKDAGTKKRKKFDGQWWIGGS